MAIPLLACLAGCPKGIIPGRVFLPDKQHGEPAVSADQVCNMVSVALGTEIARIRWRSPMVPRGVMWVPFKICTNIDGSS